MKPKRIFVAVMVSVSTQLFAAGQPQAIGLGAVAESAISRNPEVEARFHALQVAMANRDAARGGYYPQVDLTANWGTEWRGRPNVASMDFDRRGAALTLRQMIYDGLETRSEVGRLGFASLVRYYELLDAVENTALEAGRAYVDVLRYQELVGLAKENLANHRQVFKQIEERTHAGVGRRVDLEQAAGRLALAQSNLLTETSNLHDVTARYQRIIGELPPAGMPGAEVGTEGIPNTAVAALESAYQGNPGLAATQQNVRAAQEEARGKKAGFHPRLDLRARDELAFNTDGIDGKHRDRVVELVLNYNLFRGGTDSARVHQFAEQVNVARDLRDKSCRDLRQTLEIAYNDSVRLQQQLGFLDQHQLSIAKAREAYRSQFDIGKRTLLDLLDTENEYFEARRAYTNGSHDLKVARLRTLAGMGALAKTLGLRRSDLPTPEALGEASEKVDVSAACPAEAPAVVPVE